MCHVRVVLVLALMLGGVAESAADAAVLKATYRFNSSLAADQVGVPGLVPTDPLGLSHFETANVFGQPRTVYQVDGNNSPNAEQAGLTFMSAGLLSPGDYSTELVFKFQEHSGSWRRIIDVQNRASDNGFYVDPANRLDVYPISGSTDSFILGTFYHVVLVNDHQTVRAYLNGNLEFEVVTPVMDIANAGGLVHLFLDNNMGPANLEFSDAQIALAKFYDGALTSAEVAALAVNPFANSCDAARGDLNADGFVTNDDVGPFVSVLLGIDNDPGHVLRADLNCDGAEDGQDINPMVARLIGG